MKEEMKGNTASEWAEDEVRLACKRENPDWDGKSFDYGCSCYQSALKAYKSICGDGHSGFSLTEYKDEACDFGNPINDPDLKSARDRVDAAISEKDLFYEKGNLHVREVEEK